MPPPTEPSAPRPDPTGSASTGTSPLTATKTGWAADTALADPSAAVSRAAHAERGEHLSPGATVGRYVVLERIGAGGMGVVYAAYDPELDRKVALKLLRPDGGDTSDSAGASTRLLREAQAMARLSHPNVVTVHDVGTFDDQVFVAMEFVDGGTLRQWLAAEPRPLPAILEAFAKAGTGLAAAHAAGLIHRDFKPDNVLVGRDGRVRVVDFGLARRHGEVETPASRRADRPGSAEHPSFRALAADLTRSGAVMGTPAYMAPEQHLGLQTDARTDQFSFSVALYEALYGLRPFQGETQNDLRAAVLTGAVPEPPRDSKVPERLRRIIWRGLSQNAAARYPSMHALLHELLHDPAAQRRRLWRTSLLLLLVTGAAVAAVWLARGPRETPCGGATARLEGVWDGERKERLLTAFARTGAAWAADAATLAARALDDWSERWRGMHEDACLATHVRREQSETLMEARMSCLSRRLVQMRALVDLFVVADAGLTRRAVNAVHTLADVAECADVAALGARVPPPSDPTLRAQVDALRTALAEITAQRVAGRFEVALTRAETLAKQADDLGYRPLVAAASLELGLLRAQRGKLREAEESLTRAFVAGLGATDDHTAVRAALRLSGLVGDELGQPSGGHRWVEIGAGLKERLGRDPVLEASLEVQRGLLASAAGDLAAAEAHDRRAVELSERALGKEHPQTAMRVSNLGVTLYRRGRIDDALAEYRRALALAERALGKEHPDLAPILNNLGVVENERGDYRASITSHERALTLRTRALGAEHPAVAESHNNLGASYKELMELGRAREHFERALRLYEKTQGATHPNVAMASNNLGSLEDAAGAPLRALPYLRRALELWRAQPPSQRVDAAFALQNLGWAHRSLGQHAEASERFREAVALRETALGKIHPLLGEPLLGLAEVALDRGLPAVARADAERAVAILGRHRTEPVLLARARFALARALWESPAERAAAKDLAGDAAKTLAAQGPARRVEAARVAAWLKGK